MRHPGFISVGMESILVFQCEKAKVAAPFSVYASISKPNGFPIENTELEQKIRDFVDAQPQLAARYQIASIPTVMLFQNGQVAGTCVGYCPQEQLERMLP